LIKEVRSHRLWRSRQPAVVRYRQRADGLADQAARSLNFTMRIVLQSAPMAPLFLCLGRATTPSMHLLPPNRTTS
jgi:hypothetical protein